MAEAGEQAVAEEQKQGAKLTLKQLAAEVEELKRALANLDDVIAEIVLDADEKSPDAGGPATVKRGSIVQYFIEGSGSEGCISVVRRVHGDDAFHRLDLLVMPEVGGEVQAIDAIPHRRGWMNISSPNTRKRGCWEEL